MSSLCTTQSLKIAICEIVMPFKKNDTFTVECARKAGKAAQAKGTAHRFDSEKGKAARAKSSANSKRKKVVIE